MDIKPIAAGQVAQNAASADTLDRKVYNRNEDDSAKAEVKPSPEITSGVKAIFAVDDYNKVVIRLIGKDGKTIMQFPPEQLIKMSKELKLPVKNLFSKEV